MRLIPAALAVLPLLAAPVLADNTSGTILAYDRLANVIVLTDKTHWTLDPKTMVPSDLQAGDEVTLEFESSGESGAGPVKFLTRN